VPRRRLPSWQFSTGFSRWDTRCGILLAICAWRGILPRLKVEHIRYYVICGVLGVAIPNHILVVVVGHIPAGVVAVALSTTPIMTYAIALAWRFERFNAMRASGLLLALIGTLFIIFPTASLPTTGAAPWFVMALITPILYAVTNVLADRLAAPQSRSLPVCWLLAQ